MEGPQTDPTKDPKFNEIKVKVTCDSEKHIAETLFLNNCEYVSDTTWEPGNTSYKIIINYDQAQKIIEESGLEDHISLHDSYHVNFEWVNDEWTLNRQPLPLETVNIEAKCPESSSVTMNIRFMDGDTFVSGGDYILSKGVHDYSDLEQHCPAGYKITDSGDFYAEDGAKLDVQVEKIQKDVVMNIRFMDGDTFVAGGDYTLPEGVQNYNILTQYVPEGYKMSVAGDFMVKENGKLDVPVEKIQKDVVMNIRFMDGDTFVAGGDYTLPEGVQNYDILTQYVPEGYRMTVSGDFMVTAGGKLDVPVEKISTPVDPTDPTDPGTNPGGNGGGNTGNNDDDDDNDVEVSNFPRINLPGRNTTTIDDEDVPLNDRPNNTTTIDDEDVPLADLPDDTVTIDDGEVPLKANPSTGDSLPFAAMAAAALSLGGVIVLNRKKK